MKQMMLLTKAHRKALPGIRTTECDLMDATAQVKFFTPDANHTFFAIEFDPETEEFFGYVYAGFGPGTGEFTYFTLDQLKTQRGRFGLPIERDKWFRPMTMGKALETERIPH